MSLKNPNSAVTEERLKEFYNTILPYLGGSAEAGFTPVGTVISVMGVTAPANYLACDGTVYNIADYPELANYFYQQFGSKNKFGGNGTTTFAVPDLRGEFLRGTGTNSHTNQGNGAAVGVHQDATTTSKYSTSSAGTQHATIYNSGNRLYPTNFDSEFLSAEGTLGLVTLAGTSASTGNTKDLITSRPTNTSVLFCIATKNIYLNPSMDYSTDEKVVGTWIDGKTLYQKTIEVSNITFTDTTSTKYIDLLEASNLNLIDAKGIGEYTVNNRTFTRVLNNATYNDAHNTLTMATDFYKDSSNNYIRLRIAQTVTASLVLNIHVTIQYTKTS